MCLHLLSRLLAALATQNGWLKYSICEQKIALHSAQFSKLGMFKSNFDIEQHGCLALFLTIFYVNPWIQCLLSFEATVNDLGFFHQLRSVQGKSNLPPFCDGFIAAALNRLDAHLRYLSEEMAFLAFFSKQLTVNEKKHCRKEMLRYKPKWSLAFQKLGKVVTPEVKKCTRIKEPIDTKFVSDSRKNGNITKFFGSASFAMGKRFQLKLFKENFD